MFCQIFCNTLILHHSQTTCLIFVTRQLNDWVTVTLISFYPYYSILYANSNTNQSSCVYLSYAMYGCFSQAPPVMSPLRTYIHNINTTRNQASEIQTHFHCVTGACIIVRSISLWASLVLMVTSPKLEMKKSDNCWHSCVAQPPRSPKPHEAPDWQTRNRELRARPGSDCKLKFLSFPERAFINNLCSLHNAN